MPNHSPVRAARPASAAAGELALELGAGEACPARKSETTARIAEEGSSDDSNGGPEGSWRPDRFRLRDSPPRERAMGQRIEAAKYIYNVTAGGEGKGVEGVGINDTDQGEGDHFEPCLRQTQPRMLSSAALTEFMP